jgi:glutathione S-transferase
MIKLFEHPLSGNAHKVRLLLGYLGVAYEGVHVDLPVKPEKAADLLQHNSLGEVPVIIDGDVVLRDSQAILVYLARKHGGETWLPSDAAGQARVFQWLSFAANEIYHGPNLARVHYLFNFDLDVELAKKRSARVLQILDAHLASRSWLELDRPTIADVACLPYVALAGEGKIPLADYSNVVAWIERLRSLKGFVPMPGLDRAAAA